MLTFRYSESFALLTEGLTPMYVSFLDKKNIIAVVDNRTD
jgi:hypothetical protein